MKQSLVMRIVSPLLGLSCLAIVFAGSAMSQNPPAKQGPTLRPALMVTSSAFADGAEVPPHFAQRGGDNKSPAFEFHWYVGTNPTSAPENLKTYAVTLRDMDMSRNRTALDELHWSAYNIPGSAHGIPEGLAPGDLPDGTRNGPGQTDHYNGPGAPAEKLHHYVFEFFALDTKLDLPAGATRDDLLQAMSGHIIGKSVWFGRFHALAQ